MTTTPQAALLSAQNPLLKRCYTMSEPHLSGYRVVIGFERLEDAQDAHEYIAKLQATQEPVQAGELPPLPSNAHWEERIKTLMQQTPLPNSMSVYQAFKQFQNEFEHATVEYARAALSARKPLTEEQRAEVFRAAESRMVHTINLSWRNAVVDEVERAHGIGLEVKP